MSNFWLDLPKPFTVLAPMDGVTDVVFRQLVTKIGRPDVFFTEFTNTDGLLSEGKERVLEKLKFGENEQPIVAHIWGNKPEHFYKSAKMAVKLGFSGIDINTGCPDKTVVKHGSCSALIKNPTLAAEIIQATKEGAGDLPVSVKARIGFYQESIGEWLRFLLKQNIATLSIHLRTVKELSLVPAHWELMPKIMQLRDRIAPQTLIIGNGDIKSLAEVQEKFERYHCDGFMIGRGIFHNPWVFNKQIDLQTVTVAERLDLYLEHIHEFKKTWKNKNFALLKKFCKTYINNFDGASDMREKMMMSKTIEELEQTLLSAKTALV